MAEFRSIPSVNLFVMSVRSYRISSFSLTVIGEWNKMLNMNVRRLKNFKFSSLSFDSYALRLSPTLLVSRNAVFDAKSTND